MTAESLLTIRLFEPLRVQLGDREPIDEHYPRRKAKALFVYLYLHRGHQISKYQLLADLWPEAEQAGPGRVKHTVQVLRAVLEGSRSAGGWRIIQERGGSYSFNVAAPRSCDAEDFEAELVAGQRARQAGDAGLALDHYRRSIALHTGPFLAEFRYDDWAADDIARQQELFLQALEDGAQLEGAAGNYARAIGLLRRAIVEDPLHEGSYADLMRYLWLEGRRTEALRTYLRLREVLARRLDVAPQAHTTRLYEAIRRDHALAV